MKTYDSAVRTIEPINDPTGISRALSLAETVVDKPDELKLDWISAQQWAAVPVESALHFNWQDARRLSKAMRAIGCKEVLAVATEPITHFPMCYRVSTSVKGLFAFSKECGHFYFLLVPESLNFAVLCSIDLYYIVAGDRNFVTQALGTSIEVARKDYLEFADVEGRGEDANKYLISVAHRYEHCNGV